MDSRSFCIFVQMLYDSVLSVTALLQKKKKETATPLLKPQLNETKIQIPSKATGTLFVALSPSQLHCSLPPSLLSCLTGLPCFSSLLRVSALAVPSSQHTVPVDVELQAPQRSLSSVLTVTIPPLCALALFTPLSPAAMLGVPQWAMGSVKDLVCHHCPAQNWKWCYS